jgi:predicted porin
MALGAMMVAGSAAPAAAASQVDFSGYYRTYFMNEYNLNAESKTSDEDSTHNDSFFVNRLNLDFAFRPTDELAVFWRLRAPANQKWGGTGVNDGNRAATTVHVYGEIKQDWGTIDIGRLSSNFSDIGLASLGYAPGGPDPVAYTYVGPFDDDAEWDGIRYSNRWDNGFQFVAQYNRLNRNGTPLGDLTEVNADGIPTFEAGDSEDINTDLFIAEGAYFWDGGGASLALLYQRDAANRRFYETWRQGIPGVGPNIQIASYSSMGPLQTWFINPAVAHSWGDFSFHFEGKAGWGRVNSISGAEADLIDPANPGNVHYEEWTDESYKTRGLGLYLDFDYNYGPGNVNLAGWWTSGTDPNKDNDKDRNLVDMGGAFAPLLVAYNPHIYSWGRFSEQSIVSLANERSGGNFASFSEEGSEANHWAVALSGTHAFNDDISLTYAVAQLGLNHAVNGAGKNIGTETDLGLQIQLLDNLQFTTSAGYLFTGKALDGYNRPLAGGGAVAVNGGPDNKAKDAYTWYSSLTFNF